MPSPQRSFRRYFQHSKKKLCFVSNTTFKQCIDIICIQLQTNFCCVRPTQTSVYNCTSWAWRGYTTKASETRYKAIKEEGIKISTYIQILQILSIALLQVKACNTSENLLNLSTLRKMSVFGVFLVLIFSHSPWIQIDSIQFEYGKIRIRRPPNSGTFHALLNVIFLVLIKRNA